MDVILALADYLLMVGYGVYDKTEPCWILPDLKSTSQPGAKLGSQMKALFEESDCVRKVVRWRPHKSNLQYSPLTFCNHLALAILSCSYAKSL
jgi:hypothetical protein